VHPFFGGKDYGRLAILGEFQLSSLCTMFASLVYRCEWVYDVVDENRDTMRKEEGWILSKTPNKLIDIGLYVVHNSSKKLIIQDSQLAKLVQTVQPSTSNAFN
jgi:hypothetical protein